ncbi:hypothetical protein COZ55_00485 [archaeon CG_4_8_14_3_um_filter_38_5]|nr:MAG: hypothetical protein COS64_04715 [archaeon CG06_land_8_20_14_3_00_37_11]PIX44333.1 MAG: hypothetical protein COZ55_00485 [archaeon CG_4_8_14_3_um_filter_38_5]
MKLHKNQSLDKLINEICDIELFLTPSVIAGIQEIIKGKYPDIDYNKICYDKKYAMNNAEFVEDYLKKLKILYSAQLDKSLYRKRI